jgi:hypothetical protein
MKELKSLVELMVVVILVGAEAAFGIEEMDSMKYRWLRRVNHFPSFK